jgi:hypothetical protein
VVNEARSGYWRLFFMKMQEEALKQYEEKTGKEVAPSTKPIEESKPEVKTPQVKRKKVVRTVEEVTTRPILPIHTPDKTEDLMQSLWLISSELHVTMLQIPQYITLLNARQLRITQAANDADMRIRLLLLAA